MAMIHVHLGFSFANAALNRKSFVHLEDKMVTEEANYHEKLLNTWFGVPESGLISPLCLSQFNGKSCYVDE